MYKRGILRQVHMEGHRDGWAQASQMSWDEAYEDGRTLGWIQAEKCHKRERWLCFLAGAALSALVCWGLA